MAHYLPPELMKFFRAPPPLKFLPVIEKRKMPPYSGVSQWLHRFKNEVPEPIKNDTPQELRLKRKAAKQVKRRERIEREKVNWNPHAPKNPENYTTDAYNTLYVGRLPYDLDESDLKTEFEYYGPIKKVCLVRDQKGKSRGYAFVEFENEKDFIRALDHADGQKIRDRRIVVDVERGRTVKDFLPTRLGGTLGGDTRRGQRVRGREVLEPRQRGQRMVSSSSSYRRNNRKRSRSPRRRHHDYRRERSPNRRREYGSGYDNRRNKRGKY